MSLADEREREVLRLAMAGSVPWITHEVAQRLCRRWAQTGRFRDVEQVAAASLKVGRSTGMLYQLAWAKQVLEDPASALELYDTVIQRYEKAGDRRNVAATLNTVGLLHQSLGSLDEALHHFSIALPIAREIGDRKGEVVTLSNIGAVYRDLEQPDHALHHYRQAIPLQREAGNRGAEAELLNSIAKVHLDRGEFDLTVETLEKALELTDDDEMATALYYNLSAIHAQRGQLTEALSAAERAGELAAEIGHSALPQIHQLLRRIEGGQKILSQPQPQPQPPPRSS